MGRISIGNDERGKRDSTLSKVGGFCAPPPFFLTFGAKSDFFGYSFETKQGMVGSWAHKPFCVPIPYFGGINFSLQDFPCIPKGRFSQLLIREGRGCRDQGGAIKRPQCSLGVRPSSRNIHHSIFEFFSRTKTPTDGRC